MDKLRIILLGLFSSLAVPWVLGVSLSRGVASNDWPKRKTEVICFLLAVYSYPVLLLLAYRLSRRYLLLCLLPMVSVVLFFIAFLSVNL